MPNPRSKLVLSAAFAVSFAMPAKADDIAACVNSTAHIVQFAAQIGNLRSKAEAEINAAQAANPNMDDAKSEELVGKAYAPMMGLCEKLQVRETVDLCSKILSAGSAGGNLDQVTQASQTLQSDPIVTCYAQ